MRSPRIVVVARQETERLRRACPSGVSPTPIMVEDAMVRLLRAEAARARRIVRGVQRGGQEYYRQNPNGRACFIVACNAILAALDERKGKKP